MTSQIRLEILLPRHGFLVEKLVGIFKRDVPQPQQLFLHFRTFQFAPSGHCAFVRHTVTALAGRQDTRSAPDDPAIDTGDHLPSVSFSFQGALRPIDFKFLEFMTLQIRGFPPSSGTRTRPSSGLLNRTSPGLAKGKTDVGSLSKTFPQRGLSRGSTAQALFALEKFSSSLRHHATGLASQQRVPFPSTSSLRPSTGPV